MIFPANNYQPGYFQQPVPQTTPQQNNIVVTLPTVEDAERYPVAPGTGVVIKVSNSPFILCKSMGYSQFDQPTLKWYKLLEEEPKHEVTLQEKEQIDFSKLQNEIAELREIIDSKLQPKKNAKEITNV